MIILQNKWYNNLVASFHLDEKMFQIRQQDNFFIRSDKELYNIQNIKLPKSLTCNPSAYPLKKFSDQYYSLVNHIKYKELDIEKYIGKERYQKWINYLNNINPQPKIDKIPAVFRQWGMIFAPSVASTGASVLAGNILINSINKNKTESNKIHFVGDFCQLIKKIKVSEEMHLNFISEFSSADIKDTWAKEQLHVKGLLNTFNEKYHSINYKFAKSSIELNLKIKLYTIWPSTPGSWYNSSLFNSAYQDKSIPLWENFFGKNGEMKYFINSIVIAGGIEMTLFSDFSLCNKEKDIVIKNSTKGL